MPRPSEEPLSDEAQRDLIIGLGDHSLRKSYFPALQETLRAGAEQENLFRGVFDSSFEFMAVLDAQGVLIKVNRAALALVGVQVSQVIGLPFWDTPWWGTDEVRARLRRWVARSAAGEQIRAEVEHRAVDGRVVQVDFSLTPVRDERGGLCYLIAEGRDITARKELEEQLRQVQKMEAIGQLAGGIAHDFKNILGVILGGTELLGRRLTLDEKTRNLHAMTMQAIQNATDLANKLLTFSRKSLAVATSCDLHALIRDTTTLLERTIDQRIVLDLSLAATDPVVIGDPSLLQSVLLNLGINARDAMPSGGVLRLATRDLRLDEDACRNRHFGLHPGPHVAIEVSDTGTGIPPAIRDRIFEPFFTTKEPGKGTGLGLAMVFSTVKEHGGSIAVSSEPGFGTTFTILLPVHAEAVVAAPEDDGELVHGHGLVLLVEDEPVIRLLTSGLLNELGYEVLQARDGLEGIEMAKTHIGRIDAVLLDMMMPRMNGEEFLVVLQQVVQDLPVILASGTTGSHLGDMAYPKSLLWSLTKPYRASELSRIVAEAVQARPRKPAG